MLLSTGNSRGQPSKFLTQKKDPKIGQLQFRELQRLSISPNTSLIPGTVSLTFFVESNVLKLNIHLFYNVFIKHLS